MGFRTGKLGAINNSGIHEEGYPVDYKLNTIFVHGGVGQYAEDIMETLKQNAIKEIAEYYLGR